MSGGVDSSVSALLLKEEGYEVHGVSLDLYSCDRPMGKGCCTPADRLDARKICETLSIPFSIVDLKPEFYQTVVRYFVDEYKNGRTPLPCAPCNSDLRFQALLDFADQIGASSIATGHYAKVDRSNEKKAVLCRAKDRKKDQSYFLFGISQKIVDRLLLPLGDWNKTDVRKKAAEGGLITSDKDDSQELCFVGDREHARYIEEHFPEETPPEGMLVDTKGHALGRHRGIHHYTVGQRKGLGVTGLEKRYVIQLNAASNEVVLGSREELRAIGLKAKPIYWHRGPVIGEKLLVKIRSTHPGVMATVADLNGSITIHFEEAQYAVAPGQAAVLYDGEIVVGGATIIEAV